MSRKNPRKKQRKSGTPSIGRGAPARFDPAGSSERARRARESAGPRPWLIGFEAVGIQEFIVANSRPVAMEGASQIVEGFDRDNIEGERAEGTVFAGGGRGLKVVAEDRVEATCAELEGRYSDRTCGGQLAIACVPLDLEHEAISLRWLRLKLDGAKDAARPPDASVPQDEICTDCKVRARATFYENGEELVPCCWRCAKAVKYGRANRKGGPLSLMEIDKSGFIAAISADGNNLGAMFADLSSLEDNAICSDLIFAIFKQAHQAACPKDAPFVAPVVGGDDIRVFLPPRYLFDYARTIAREVEALALEVRARKVPKTIADALGGLGVGVGAVVAPYRYPAHRLLEMAHGLEDSAKAVCHPKGPKSALDFLWLKSGEELSQARGCDRPAPLDLAPPAIDSYLERARALGCVSTSQRAQVVGARRGLDELEFMNLFRYQVARTPSWQAWFDACGINWRDPDAVATNLPDSRMLDVVGLLGGRQ